jgi:hypothetical protein
MERTLNVEDTVIYIDSHRKPRRALVTKVWNSVGNLPGCNLVVVCDDESKTDGYGRQIERFTSVVHLSQNAAKGWCWCWPDEVPAAE